MSIGLGFITGGIDGFFNEVENNSIPYYDSEGEKKHFFT